MKWLIWLLFPIHVFAALNDVDKAMVWPKNILPNGGFENGRQGWTASGGTLATVTSGSNLLTGKVSATWDSNGAAQTLRTSSITIPKGLYGKNGVLVCKTQVPSGSATTTMNVDDGTNDLATAQTIPTTTAPVYNYLNFIFPSSGNIRVEFTSVASNEPLIVFDDCFLGDAEEINLTNISQAQFVGSAYLPAAASCTGAVTSTSLAALTVNSACLGPTVDASPVGTWSTSDQNLFGFVISNLPAGNYVGRMNFPQGAASASAQTGQIGVAVNGVAVNGRTQVRTQASVSPNPDSVMVPFNWQQTSSSGTVTIEAFAAIPSSAITIANVLTTAPAGRVTLDLWRFPTTSEQAYRPSAVPFYWHGIHAQDCTWTTTSTSYAAYAGDTSCTFTERVNLNAGTVTTAFNGALSVAPGIVFTPPRVGTFEVCVFGNGTTPAGGGIAAGWRLTDGTTNFAEAQVQENSNYLRAFSLCGTKTLTSLAAQTFTIRGITQSGTNTLGGNATYSPTASLVWFVRDVSQAYASPLLVGSVTTGSRGSSRLEFARITYSAGTPSVDTQSGSWISTVGDNGTGDFTVNIRSGIFSAQPICTCTARSSTSNVICLQDLTTTPSSTLKRFQIFTDAGTAVDDSAEIMCIGPK